MHRMTELLRIDIDTLLLAVMFGIVIGLRWGR
jgi:hypothetical protein